MSCPTKNCRVRYDTVFKYAYKLIGTSGTGAQNLFLFKFLTINYRNYWQGYFIFGILTHKCKNAT